MWKRFLEEDSGYLKSIRQTVRAVRLRKGGYQRADAGNSGRYHQIVVIAVQDWLEKEKLDSKLIMQVHDELVLDVPEKELVLVREKLPELMAQVARLKVPLIAEVGVGDNWDQAH